MSRSAQLSRKTGETDVRISLDLDSSLAGKMDTGVGFFDHMLDLPPGAIAGFEHEAAEEFFRAVASAARLTLHVELQAGTNAHHMIEACFKAFARALRAAVAIDPDETGVPSTKGTLT